MWPLWSVLSFQDGKGTISKVSSGYLHPIMNLKPEPPHAQNLRMRREEEGLCEGSCGGEREQAGKV